MIVVKVGGGEGIDYDALCTDIAHLRGAGQPLVLLHGGSHETNILAERLGHPPRFVTSPSGFTSRYTDRTTLEIFMMAYAGKMNKLIVERLQRLRVNAIGISGLDGRVLEGQRKTAIRIVENGRQRVLRDDWTGTVEQVNDGLLTILLEGGYLPVIAPLASSTAGEAVNVDGDRAAAAVAAALKAETLLLLSNVPGLLRAFPDEDSLITHIPRGEVDKFLPFAEGRMKKKVLGASEALVGGVGQVILGDARVEQPISHALDGHGTIIA
ncbi:MAG: [LysW]-aminoadipate kinase [Chloroflexi bacterium AL-W]|nr:[LysW]-aminoadipate kinase [Chloroflexi bacterium AL-N1]NOK65071.1 [LysW]-aminoadipate kinase [Chloroflexi bacterium AL-N10]NOK72662.1 [LysW]-aminoadipate kinase [Chloroflexi bacterium AL-N5]NOK79250.1 [LysW]-aminoadipate kinase [Chloroflexi bacterium AL-W]NOK87166.1 [LysW]-aminoadipate kinase [Chloroflexi bacterium AL-N15]